LDKHITANKMRTVKITNVSEETPMVKSFTFSDPLCANASPGQFAMIWIPSIDEVPMSLSMLNPRGRQAAITAERVGEATSALHKMRKGDLIGVRGPFGNSYAVTKAHKVMIVGGGTGLASLAPLVDKLTQETARITLLMGAKTNRELLFHDRMSQVLAKTKGQLIATTEDGTFGLRGLVTTQAEKLLNKGEKFDTAIACGPEKMMYKTFLLTEKFRLPLQASLERFMRCAIGICGTCTIGKYRVCKDGPVFTGQQLREVQDEFGHWRRGFDGTKTTI